jgi:apoptosis-inducing factor 3
MSDQAIDPSLPDLAQGIPIDAIPEEGMVSGRVGETLVLLSRFEDRLFAVDGACTHYGAGLGEGLRTGTTVRCPLHHACFDLRTGAALKAPAFAALGRWKVAVEGGRAFVRERDTEPLPAPPAPRRAGEIESIVIVGAGAAGFACAERLRALGYSGRLTMIGRETDPPYDRPNLSKDWLAGKAPDQWMPLREPGFYVETGIDLRLGIEVTTIDPAGRTIAAADGETFGFDRLLLAPGSRPVDLTSPGLDDPRVHMLRSFADARAIAARCRPGAKAVVVGSSFIGLEAAAALRGRGVEIDVVSVEEVPFSRILGPAIGGHLRRLHEEHGVRFHMGEQVRSFDGTSVLLSGGASLAADFVLVGIGVRPDFSLAETAGLATGDGILVDGHLETSAPGIYAAGDVAAYPDPATGRRIRIEHWVTAQRQGQCAAANMLGLKTRFIDVPFFWSAHYGTTLRYVGHAPVWTEIEIDGFLVEGDFTARFYDDWALRACASVGRDGENLQAELYLEEMTGPPPEPRDISGRRREPALTASL